MCCPHAPSLLAAPPPFSRRRSPNRPSAISIGHPPMPSASLDRPIKQRVKIYPWRSESKCRTKCVHTLALSRGRRETEDGTHLCRSHDRPAIARVCTHVLLAAILSRALPP